MKITKSTGYLEAGSFLKLWNEIRQLQRETDRGLCLKVGISPAAVTHWRTGRSKRVKPQLLRQIEERLGYKIQLRGDGGWEINKTSAEIDLVPADERMASAHQRAIEARRARAMQGDYPTVRRIYDEEGQPGFVPPQNVRKDPFGAMGPCWFEVKDSSMEPRYYVGDKVLFRTDIKPSNGDFAVVLLQKKKDALIRRVFINGDNVALVALGSPSDVVPVRSDQIVFWARIIDHSHGQSTSTRWDKSRTDEPN